MLDVIPHSGEAHAGIFLDYDCQIEAHGDLLVRTAFRD
jgi:hypothetical protein